MLFFLAMNFCLGERMKQITTVKEARVWSLALNLLVCLALLFAAASTDAQQKDKKKKKNSSASDGRPIIPMADEQQIDYMISTLLGAWQLNDVDRMHQCYADEATFVSGTWAPPVVGWANYVPLYKQQRARTQQVRLERTNTLIRVAGAVAWASYQWDFSGTVDGQPMPSQGQTTLVLEKRNDRWVIVHNHTSVAQVPQLGVPARQANNPPSEPAPGKPPSR
jgi:ketosteroid isomerase-like protein